MSQLMHQSNSNPSPSALPANRTGPALDCSRPSPASPPLWWGDIFGEAVRTYLVIFGIPSYLFIYLFIHTTTSSIVPEAISVKVMMTLTKLYVNFTRLFRTWHSSENPPPPFTPRVPHADSAPAPARDRSALGLFRLSRVMCGLFLLCLSTNEYWSVTMPCPETAPGRPRDGPRTASGRRRGVVCRVSLGGRFIRLRQH